MSILFSITSQPLSPSHSFFAQWSKHILVACGTPWFDTLSLTHSAHQSDSRHRYLLGKPIYIWTNGGEEARPDQYTDIDTLHAAMQGDYSPSELILSLDEKIKNLDELLSKVCVWMTKETL
ncbi:hypothetical protein PAMP_000428 [Pampus punctatissimus]